MWCAFVSRLTSPLDIRGAAHVIPLRPEMLIHWQTRFLATEQRQAHEMMSYTSQKDKTLNDGAGRVSPGGTKEQVVPKLKIIWKAGEIVAYFIWTDGQFLVHSHGNHLGITWQLLNAPRLWRDPFITDSLHQSSCWAKCRHHQGWFKPDMRAHSKSCHLAKVKRGQHLLRDIMGLRGEARRCPEISKYKKIDGSD